MEGRLVVFILLIQDFFKQKFGFNFELSAYLIEFTRSHQLFEFWKHVSTPTWVKCFFCDLEALKLREKVKELAETWDLINVYL